MPFRVSVGPFWEVPLCLAGVGWFGRGNLVEVLGVETMVAFIYFLEGKERGDTWSGVVSGHA